MNSDFGPHRPLWRLAGLSLFLTLVSGCADHWFYQPNRQLYAVPDQFGLQSEDVFFDSQDGTRLHGLFLRSPNQSPQGTIIHFHGNYGNLSYSLAQVSWLPPAGFQVFLFDYRGYGRSAGKPGRAAIHQDAFAALDYLMARTAGDVFVFGQSLGGAVAVAALANRPYPRIRAVIIEGAFFAYRQQVVSVMSAAAGVPAETAPCLSAPLIPLSCLLATNHLSPGPEIHKLAPTPLLIIHGDTDRLVPDHHARLLYDAAHAPKTLWIVPGGGHLNIFTCPENPYRQRMLQFLRSAADSG